MHYRFLIVIKLIPLLGPILMSLGCAPSSESVKIKTVSAQENPSKITKTTWIFKKPSAAHEKLYRRVLPKAASFTEREIPKRLLTKQDSDSNYYAAAKNKTGQIFAWLRPIHAKVRKSDEEQRLQVVLVYDSKLKYQTFVLLDSVKKDDGSLFTQEEKLRLREIAKNPDPELAKMRLLRMVADSRTLKPVDSNKRFGNSRCSFSDIPTRSAGLEYNAAS
ncbi:hypothetical protein KAI87_13175 [Myxococcota bacterium]|nr:hypothetical protein [Myxococcota bacterium]